MEELVLDKAESYALEENDTLYRDGSETNLWICEKCRKEFIDKESLHLHRVIHNFSDDPYPETEIILRRDLLYKEVTKQQEVEGGRPEVTRKITYKPRRVYKPLSKRVGLTKIRVEDCLRCDACSCIYIDERDYYKHMRNFHQKYNTIIPRSRRKSPILRRSCNNTVTHEYVHIQRSKTDGSVILPIMNDAYIREKIKSRWNKVSQRLTSQLKIKQEPEDMSYLLSQVEVKIKTEPHEME